MAFSVLHDWVGRHFFSVVTPNHAIEICYPKRAVVTQCTRYKDLAVAPLVPTYVADTLLFLIPLRQVALTVRGIFIDGVTVSRMAEPKSAVFVFEDRASAEGAVLQLIVWNPFEGSSIIATSAKDRCSEPEVPLAVLENGVNIVRAELRIGEFRTGEIDVMLIASLGFGEC